MVCVGAPPDSFSPPSNQESLFVSPLVSAGIESEETIDYSLDPPLEGAPPLAEGPRFAGGPPIAWGPLYTLAGLTAAAAGGALLGALREKKPQHVAKVGLGAAAGGPLIEVNIGAPTNTRGGPPALAIAAFLLPAAGIVLLLSTSPLPGGPLSLSLQGAPQEGAPSPPAFFSLLTEYLLGALRDWQRSLSFAAACMLLLRGAQGVLLLVRAPSTEGPPLLNSKGPSPASQLSLARTTAAGTREGGAPLLSLLQAEALPTWRGPQGRRAWGLSIALQMCLLVFLPWLGAALWVLRPAAAAAAVWVSGPCLPSASAAAAAAAATAATAAAATEGSRLQYLLREAAQAAAAAKALNPSSLPCPHQQQQQQQRDSPQQRGTLWCC
ncbi:hypothetical protein Emed_001651 [Eimeria media]